MDILSELKGCRTIGISGHENPDGDCAGSCLGLALYLKKNMPDSRVDVFLEPLRPELAANIPGSYMILEDFRSDVARYDAFVVLDSSKDRIGSAENFFDSARKTINIDHHVSNPGSAQINYIDGTSSSACELVLEVIDHSLMDRDIAQALYVGIVTDTGCFRFSNTSRKTMQTAGELITYGFDFPSIVREVYFEKTWVQQRMLGRALIKSKSLVGGKLIISRLSQESIQTLGGKGKDVEGIVSALVSTTGADCAIFTHQTAEGKWRVSLRSNQTVNVAAVAEAFGGGGHVRASGCTIPKGDDIDAALRQMTSMIRAQLAEADRKKP